MHLAQILKAHFLVHVAQDFQNGVSCLPTPLPVPSATRTGSASSYHQKYFTIAHLTQVTINLHVTTVQDYGPTTNQARVPTIILGTNWEIPLYFLTLLKLVNPDESCDLSNTSGWNIQTSSRVTWDSSKGYYQGDSVNTLVESTSTPQVIFMQTTTL